MKSGNRAILGLILFVFAAAAVRAGDASGVRLIASISSPADFIKRLDGFLSVVTVDTPNAVHPGEISMKALKSFPLLPAAIDMDAPAYFILPVGASAEDGCFVFSTPDFDAFVKSVDAFGDMSIEDANDPEPLWAARLPNMGRVKMLRADPTTVLAGRNGDVLRQVRELGGGNGKPLDFDHPAGSALSATLYDPVRLDAGGMIPLGWAFANAQLERMRPRVVGDVDKLGMNSRMASGVVDLLQLLMESGLAEIRALESVTLDLTFDHEIFDAFLGMKSGDDSVVGQLHNAVSRLSDGKDHPPRFAASVPTEAFAVSRTVSLIRDPDIHGRLVKWAGVVADKLLPGRKREFVDGIAGPSSEGAPGEITQMAVARNGRELIVSFIDVGDAALFIDQFKNMLAMAAELVNGFFMEEPGKGLRLVLEPESRDGFDFYALEIAVGADSKLEDHIRRMPRDQREELLEAIASSGFRIGAVGGTVAMVSGDAGAGDFAYAVGLLSGADQPLAGVRRAAEAMDRLPGHPNGFYGLVDARTLADMFIDNLRNALDGDGALAGKLDALSRAYVGGREFVGIAMEADADNLGFRVSSRVRGLNEAFRNYLKLWRLIKDGRVDEDEQALENQSGRTAL